MFFAQIFAWLVPSWRVPLSSVKCISLEAFLDLPIWSSTLFCVLFFLLSTYHYFISYFTSPVLEYVPKEDVELIDASLIPEAWISSWLIGDSLHVYWVNKWIVIYVHIILICKPCDYTFCIFDSKVQRNAYYNIEWLNIIEEWIARSCQSCVDSCRKEFLWVPFSGNKLYFLALPTQLKNKFMKKLPRDAEASNVLVGEVDFLDSPFIAFVRLQQAVMLGALTEVPVPTR